MSLAPIQIVEIILLAASILSLPNWPYAKSWSYDPSIVFLALAVLLIVL